MKAFIKETENKETLEIEMFMGGKAFTVQGKYYSAIIPKSVLLANELVTERQLSFGKKTVKKVDLQAYECTIDSILKTNNIQTKKLGIWSDLESEYKDELRASKK